MRGSGWGRVRAAASETPHGWWPAGSWRAAPGNDDQQAQECDADAARALLVRSACSADDDGALHVVVHRADVVVGAGAGEVSL